MTIQEKIYQIKDQVEKEYADLSLSLDTNININKLSLGTSAILLNSILGHLQSTDILLKAGFIESAGATAASLWERSVTLQYMLTNPSELSDTYAAHKTVKKTPWSIRQMVNGIIDYETLSSDRNLETKKELLYLQYTYLCAVKHGSPYTVAYLNRMGKTKPDESAIGVKPNISKEDEDLKSYLLLLSVGATFGALHKFSNVYCVDDHKKKISEFNKQMTKTIVEDIKLNVPQIILTSVQEMGEDFWNYLIDLGKNR